MDHFKRFLDPCGPGAGATRLTRMAQLLALLLLFAGWMLASTYVPLVVTRLYQGAGRRRGGLTSALCGPLLGALADRWGHWRVNLSS